MQHPDKLTFKNAMASAPHCVTISVSLVSLDSTSANTTKNLMEPNKKNFFRSSPYIGNIASRIRLILDFICCCFFSVFVTSRLSLPHLNM